MADSHEGKRTNRDFSIAYTALREGASFAGVDPNTDQMIDFLTGVAEALAEDWATIRRLQNILHHI
jgi:hypothetical protein